MGDTHLVPAWPGADPGEIALAARVAMLAAASVACPPSYRSFDHDILLDLVVRATRPQDVNGRGFPEFLEAAKAAVLATCETISDLTQNVQRTLELILSAKSEDLIGETYSRLVHLVAPLYEATHGTSFRPALVRKVVQNDSRRERLVSGKVYGSRDSVTLMLYSRFGFESLILTPFILAHELICHIGAERVGAWDGAPDPDIRHFFEEGFMDKAARHYLNLWVNQGFRELAPAGYLEESMVEFNSKRPLLFRPGLNAWRNCEQVAYQAVRAGGSVLGPLDHADVVAAGAIAVNASPEDAVGKDRFVDLARYGDGEVLTIFAAVGMGRSAPSALIGRVLELTSD